MAKQWEKGGPSPNPRGRGAAFTRADIQKAKHALGSNGVVAYGGYVQSGEASSRLSGSNKWKEYANARLHPTVAIATLLRYALFCGVKWEIEENEAGSASEARRGVEVVEQGLLKARLGKPWAKIAAKAANESYFNGFDLHATAMGRRADGAVVYTDIDHRPAHTIEQWWRKARSSMGPFVEVTQRISDGATTDIPLSECLYLVNDVVSDAPDGTGVLRFVVERLRRIGHYEALEGSELFSGMGGTPIARVPLGEIEHNMPTGLTESEATAHLRSKTTPIETVVSDRVKSPEKRQYIVLSSETYVGQDPNTISSNKKWDIEILKGDLQGLPDIRKIINDYDLGVARVLGVEFVLVGGNDAAGTYGMHESKVSMFAASLTSSLNDLADSATNQLARPLCAANGLDPDTACPRLVPSPIATEDVLRTVEALRSLSMAGLGTNHPAKKSIFSRLQLPWEDEEEPVAPRGSAGGDPGDSGDGDPAPSGDVDPADREEPEREPVEKKLKRLREREAAR